MNRIKQRFNRWLFRKYGFVTVEKIPFIFKICPLFSPSLFMMCWGEKVVEWLDDGMKAGE